ncbi:MAG: tetratricopeptide repeat protein [Planctomycetes bacterium]|nr:tetratricopeptide repeat protein [Planctomycetota bacterium]
MRHAVLLLLLCGCSSLTHEQQQLLAGHQRNAKYYLEGGRIDQALDQIDRGLAIEPDDYQLRAMRGRVLLQQSASSMSTDHQLLDEATAILADVYRSRSATRHEPFVLLPYALALQKQGRRRLGEEVRLRGQASRAPNPQELLAAADVQRDEALDRLTRARDVLDVLIDRGELLRPAWNHKLQIAQDLGDDAGLVAAAQAYLEQAAKDQAVVRREIDRTTVPAYEAEQVQRLRSLQAEELEVRALLADHHFSRQQYEAALAQLNRVLELEPQRLTDYYNRGRVLMELGRADEAKADFKKFVENSTLPATNDKIALAMKALYP